MAFMQAYIEPVSGYWMVNEYGDRYLLDDEYNDTCPHCGWSFRDEKLGPGDACYDCGAEVEDRFVGFAGGLSAPGYMDQTEPVYGETKAEVAEQLLDMYFDQPEEEMDANELSDMEWLERVAAGVE